MLQGEVQAALGQRDAALEQQATLQELLASSERRAATAATAEPSRLGIDSTELVASHTKVSRLSLDVHIVSPMSFIMHSHSVLDCRLVVPCNIVVQCG